MSVKRFCSTGRAVLAASIFGALIWANGCGGDGSVKAQETDFEVKPAEDKKSVEIVKYTGPGGISIIIPAKIQGMPVSKIGDEAFHESIITGAVIPEGVTEIGEKAFYGSTIASITLPNSLKVIERSAFEDCAALTSITIPANVTNIGYAAFNNCKNIQSIISLNPNPPSISVGHWSGRGATFSEMEAVVLVPAASLDAYREANGWESLDPIIDIESAPVKNGRLHGKVTIEKDRVKIIMAYKDGVRHGKNEGYDEKGKLRTVSNFKDGKEVKTEIYYESGKIAISTIHNDGDDGGKMEWFYENGKKAIVTNIKGEEPDMEKMEAYDENGQFVNDQEQRFEIMAKIMNSIADFYE